MTGERWILRGGVWRRRGWDAVQPGGTPQNPGEPPPVAPRFQLAELLLLGTGTDPGTGGGGTGGGGTATRTQFGACILSTGVAGVPAKYGNTAAVREFLSSTLTWANNVPPGSKMQRSYKLVDNGVTLTASQVDTFLRAVVATGDGHVVTLDHEPDNNGWTTAQIAAYKANNNLLYDRIEALGYHGRVFSAPTFTGGLWSSNQNDSARDVWMVGLKGHLIGVDYDGVHDNATSRPSDNRYRRGGTIITNADEVANVNRYLTRFAANGWLGATAPEFGISRASWDTDGSGRALWILENGQRFVDAKWYLVQWYDFRDTKTGISDIIDPGTKELAQMQGFVALNQAA